MGPFVSRDDSHANLYSGNVTPLPFVGEEEEGGDARARGDGRTDEDDDEPFEGTNFESVIAPGCTGVSRVAVTRGIFWGTPNKGRQTSWWHESTVHPKRVCPGLRLFSTIFAKMAVRQTAGGRRATARFQQNSASFYWDHCRLFFNERTKIKSRFDQGEPEEP